MALRSCLAGPAIVAINLQGLFEANGLGPDSGQLGTPRAGAAEQGAGGYGLRSADYFFWMLIMLIVLNQSTVICIVIYDCVLGNVPTTPVSTSTNVPSYPLIPNLSQW